MNRVHQEDSLARGREVWHTNNSTEPETSMIGLSAPQLLMLDSDTDNT